MKIWDISRAISMRAWGKVRDTKGNCVAGVNSCTLEWSEAAFTWETRRSACPSQSTSTSAPPVTRWQWFKITSHWATGQIYAGTMSDGINWYFPRAKPVSRMFMTTVLRALCTLLFLFHKTEAATRGRGSWRWILTCETRWYNQILWREGQLKWRLITLKWTTFFLYQTFCISICQHLSLLIGVSLKTWKNFIHPSAKKCNCFQH